MDGKRYYRFLLPILLTLVVLAFGSESFAASKKSAQKKEEPAKKEEKASATKDTDEIGAYRRKRVEVIQDRLFHKRNKSELSFAVGMVPDNAFYFYTAIDVKYTYHFTEYLGLEGNFTYFIDSKTDLLKAIERDLGQTVATDILDYYVGGEFIFTPLYGKFAFLTKNILYWDFFVAIGVGGFKTHVLNDNNFRFAGNFGVGMHVIFNKWVAGRFDFRNYTYREEVDLIDSSGNRIEGGSVVNAQEYLFGVSVFLPPL